MWAAALLGAGIGRRRFMVLSHRLRRPPLVIALAFVLAAATSGCGATTPTPASTLDTSCDKWCGNGRATITFEGGTAAISTGGCYGQGAAGIDARFGDWLGVKGLSSYLMLTFYPAAPVATSSAGASSADSSGSIGRTGFPSASSSAGAGGSAPAAGAAQGSPIPPEIDGSVGGAPFVLGPASVVSYNTDGTGSFSGTDVNTGEMATGTFSCH